MATFLSAGSFSPYSLSCFSVVKMFEVGVDLVDALLLGLVLLLVGLGLVAHALDLLLSKARGGLDTDLLLLARALVQRNVQDAVGVDVERNLDLRNAARCGGNAVSGSGRSFDLVSRAGGRSPWRR